MARTAGGRCLNLIERVNLEIKDPTWVIEVYEEYRVGEISDLPPRFLSGTEGVCNAILVIFHVCDLLGIDISMINEGTVEEMRLAPIMDRYGDIETLICLCQELVSEA